MRQYLIVGIFLLLSFPATAADNGIISNPSGSSVPETLDRLEKVIKAKGLTVFARIDHSAEAERAGLKLPPMQLLIFGNPNGHRDDELVSPDWHRLAAQSAGVGRPEWQGLAELQQSRLPAAPP